MPSAPAAGLPGLPAGVDPPLGGLLRVDAPGPPPPIEDEEEGERAAWPPSLFPDSSRALLLAPLSFILSIRD